MLDNRSGQANDLYFRLPHLGAGLRGLLCRNGVQSLTGDKKTSVVKARSGARLSLQFHPS